MGLDLDFQRVILEGDSLTVVKKLMEKIPETVRKAVEDDNRWTEIGHLHRYGSLGGGGGSLFWTERK